MIGVAIEYYCGKVKESNAFWFSIPYVIFDIHLQCRRRTWSMSSRKCILFFDSLREEFGCVFIKKEGYPCRERTKITKNQQMSMFIINGQKQYHLIAIEKARTRSFDCKDKRKILFGALDLQNFRKEMFCNSYSQLHNRDCHC